MIVASENQPFESMLTDYAKSQGVDLQITYSGSVDVMRELDKGDQSAYDGVWPSNSIWITLGDSHHVVKHQASVMRSPVVLGVKQSVAQRLGWIGRDVTVDDILTAAEAGNLRFMMTSATQSNPARRPTSASCTPSPATRRCSRAPISTIRPFRPRSNGFSAR